MQLRQQADKKYLQTAEKMADHYYNFSTPSSDCGQRGDSYSPLDADKPEDDGSAMNDFNSLQENIRAKNSLPINE